MMTTPPLRVTSPDGEQANSCLAEITRSVQSLRAEVDELRRERGRLQEQLAEARVDSQSERQARRAALNLMEDAIKARAAEELENAQRRRIEEELRNADRRKDEFLATLAHELRNPLAPIRSSVQILRLSRPDADAIDHLAEMLDRQVTHMVRLVDDLMEVSRITRSQIVLHRERLDFTGVVQSAIEISSTHIDAAHHQLNVALPSERLIIDGDPVRLVQIFSNILNNAGKYTPDGGVISLVAERRNTQLIVRIRDNGIGIPSEMLPRVFDLFMQGGLGPNGYPGGLGIGLTLVQQLIELHGGNISAHSEGIGCGSEFVVTLPLAPSAAVKPEIRRPSHCDTAGLTGHKVLVVDDNRDAANSLATLVTYLGNEVSIAHDGPSALSLFETERPSIVLLDIGMPEMDGHEVARRIRSTPLGESVFLIALTGWGQEEDRRRSRHAGFDHHLVKPVDLQELQRLIDAVPSK